MKLKKVFGRIIASAILALTLSSCSNYFEDTSPLHSITYVYDDFYTENNEMFVRYRDNILEVVDGNQYYKFSIEGDPIQILPITEQKFLDYKCNFSNLIIDIENKTLIAYIQDEPTEHKLTTLSKNIVPGFYEYWMTCKSYEDLYDSAVIAPDIDCHPIIFDNGAILIPQSDGTVKVLSGNTYPGGYPDYVHSCLTAAINKISVNQYLKSVGAIQYVVAYPISESQICLVLDDDDFVILGGE